MYDVWIQRQDRSWKIIEARTSRPMIHSQAWQKLMLRVHDGIALRVDNRLRMPVAG